jgi:branched-chain amino acid aminotransferase
MKAEKIWMDGELVNWDNAKVHVLTHALHYGSGIFEGIRAYKTEQGPAVFRLKDHVNRLFNSSKIMRMDIPYSKEKITKAIKETIQINKLNSCYIRPLVYRGYNQLGLNPFRCPVQVMISAWDWGAYLGEEALAKGVRAMISTWQRSHINSTSAKAKICGNYINSIFANMEAVESGVEEAILLDSNGYVAEGPGENIFWVKDGVLFTPPLTSVLEGITRKTIIKIASDMGFEIKEEFVARDVLYLADEAFFAGSAAELTPIREIDHYTIGSGERGPVSQQLQEKLFNVFKGKEKEYLTWLDFVS